MYGVELTSFLITYVDSSRSNGVDKGNERYMFLLPFPCCSVVCRVVALSNPVQSPDSFRDGINRPLYLSEICSSLAISEMWIIHGESGYLFILSFYKEV